MSRQGPEGTATPSAGPLLRRPSVSAPTHEGCERTRGSRLLDRRPPHYRCPAVPGLSISARAILTASCSFVLSLWVQRLHEALFPAGTAYCCVLLVMRTTRWPEQAPLFGSQPRRPSCVCSGLEPHCRTSRCARPQPTPSPRYHPHNFTAGYRELHLQVLLHLRSCTWQPLITAGHPVRSSAPSPSCDNPGFEAPPPHRPATALACTAAWQFVSARPC